MHKRKVDLLIIGGGVSGTALYYGFCNNVKNASVLLVEKESKLAQINSKVTANSQTLHTGEIETNYSFEQALNLRQGAVALKEYCLGLQNRHQVIQSMPKIALAVGNAEIDLLKKRFYQFSSALPQIRWFDWHDLAELEPQVAFEKGKPRQQAVAAMGYESSYCAINYELLAHSFVSQAQHKALENANCAECWLSAKVRSVHPIDNGYEVVIDRGHFIERVECRFLVASAGSYSLYLAKQLNLAKNFSLILAGGNFYYSSRQLKGKVYTMQTPGLPFAAIHGDLDVANQMTRFGPSLVPTFKMERYASDIVKNWQDYRQCFRFDERVSNALYSLLKQAKVREYLQCNLPVLGKRIFARQVRKIIPDIRLKDLQLAEGVGGARPLLIDHQAGSIVLGQAKVQNHNAIFNVAPATGASTCLNVAFADMHTIAKKLHLEIREMNNQKLFCA